MVVKCGCLLVPGPVPKPPEVQNSTLTSTSVALTWNPPGDPNGEIIGYRLLLTPLSTDPIQFGSMMMMMGGGGQGDRRRRKRQVMGGVNTVCIREGSMDNVTLGDNGTSYNASNLSEL